MSTDAAALFGQAVALGLVRAADVLDGAATLRTQSRSNVVHRLEVGGRAVAFAKQPGPAHRADGVDATARERHALRGLVGVRCAPALLDPEPGVRAGDVLWTVPVPGTAVGELDLRRTAVAPVAVAWGAALAALHGAPVGGLFAAHRAPRPWPLEDTLPRWVEQRADDPLPARVLAALRDDPDLRRARRTAARWWPAGRPPVAATWVHGDTSPSNVLLGADRRVRFIDFEDAGLGDPSWDLACSLVALRELVVSCGRGADDGRAELAASYAAHGGPGRAAPEYVSLATWLLAWQLAAAPGAGEDARRRDRVNALLELARTGSARRGVAR